MALFYVTAIDSSAIRMCEGIVVSTLHYVRSAITVGAMLPVREIFPLCYSTSIQAIPSLP